MSSRGGIIEEVVRFLSLVLGLAVLASFSGCQHGARHTAASPTTMDATTSSSTSPQRLARACTLNQVALAYRGGGLATGNDFGSIVVRDVSPTACTLMGKIAVTPLDRRGHPITIRSGEPLDVTVPAPGIGLTPNATAPIAGQNLPAGMVEPSVVLSGGERDDPEPPNGICAPTNEVQPASWRVSLLGGTLTVENRDVSAPTEEGFAAGLYGCRGSFGTPTVGTA